MSSTTKADKHLLKLRRERERKSIRLPVTIPNHGREHTENAVVNVV